MMKEAFYSKTMLKPIPTFDGYFADENGNIYSTKRHRKPKKLKKYVSSTGANIICLRSNGKNQWVAVAPLILTAFISPRPVGMWSLHGEHGRLDDRLTNLSWGTPSKNNHADKLRDGTLAVGEKNGLSKLSAEQVKQIRKLYRPSRWSNTNSYSLAKVYGVSHTTILRIIKGEHWHHLL
jgi:hypothetical protein